MSTQGIIARSSGSAQAYNLGRVFTEPCKNPGVTYAEAVSETVLCLNDHTAWFKKMDTDSLFAQTGVSDKCSSSLGVEYWNEDKTHTAQQSLTQF